MAPMYWITAVEMSIYCLKLILIMSKAAILVYLISISDQ